MKTSTGCLTVLLAVSVMMGCSSKSRGSKSDPDAGGETTATSGTDLVDDVQTAEESEAEAGSESGSGSVPDATEAHTQGERATETDSEAETGGDAESDGDNDRDSSTDEDPNVDSDTEGEVETDTGRASHQVTDVDDSTPTDEGTGTDDDSVSDSESHLDGDTDTARNTDRAAETDPGSNMATDTVIERETDTDLVDPCSVTTMPSAGGTEHNGYDEGGSGNLAWQVWSSSGEGILVTYDVPAFRASWDNPGSYMGGIGYEWESAPKPYEEFGTIAANFCFTKTGDGGDYSYIGVYGWSEDPRVEWYIVEDSFSGMPIDRPSSAVEEGEVDIDGGTYIIYKGQTVGTTIWAQYYSVRKTPRQCGTISTTEHFDAWKNLEMPLGNLVEARIHVEVSSGTGSVDFSLAEIMATNP